MKGLHPFLFVLFYKKSSSVICQKHGSLEVQKMVFMPLGNILVVMGSWTYLSCITLHARGVLLKVIQVSVVRCVPCYT